MTSIRKPGNTGITGGIKGINNKVPQSTKKADAKVKKQETGGWKPTNNNKPSSPVKPPPAR